MIVKNVCLVPHAWTVDRRYTAMDIYKLHSCSDGSHSHISESKLRHYEERKIARVIWRPREGVEARIVATRMPQYRVSPEMNLRDLSCSIGWPLVKALDEKQEWAEVMLADIKHRAVREDLLELVAALRSGTLIEAIA